MTSTQIVLKMWNDQWRDRRFWPCCPIAQSEYTIYIIFKPSKFLNTLHDEDTAAGIKPQNGKQAAILNTSELHGWKLWIKTFGSVFWPTYRLLISVRCVEAKTHRGTERWYRLWSSANMFTGRNPRRFLHERLIPIEQSVLEGGFTDLFWKLHLFLVWLGEA